MVSATGLAGDATEYRARLGEQPDQQIDSWAKELMRDLSIRIGVRRVIRDFLKAARLDPAGFERVFAAGGGAPATLGRTTAGDVMVPAIELWCLVDGIRREAPDARDRLIEYLVENFHEMTFV